MRLRIVVDTNVLAGALISASGHNRDVLRACFEGRVQPIGEALFHEYEDVLGRDAMSQESPLPTAERTRFFDAFLSTCDWTQVYYLWRASNSAILAVSRFPAGFEVEASPGFYFGICIRTLAHRGHVHFRSM
jgi:hypothetical protein